MPKRQRDAKRPQKPLDMVFAKRGRGRIGISRSEVRNRADDYRELLRQWWDVIGEPLLRAKTREDVMHAFDGPGLYRKEEFVPCLAGLILKVLRDPKFPKKRSAQINFLADSLAARGRVSPRRSRDVCAQERAKPTHYIVRQEFYIDCTCGYEGPARQGACPECGTDIVLPPGTTLTS